MNERSPVPAPRPRGSGDLFNTGTHLASLNRDSHVSDLKNIYLVSTNYEQVPNWREYYGI